jgi:hypothetical protein
MDPHLFHRDWHCSLTCRLGEHPIGLLRSFCRSRYICNTSTALPAFSSHRRRIQTYFHAGFVLEQGVLLGFRVPSIENPSGRRKNILAHIFKTLIRVFDRSTASRLAVAAHTFSRMLGPRQVVSPAI